MLCITFRHFRRLAFHLRNLDATKEVKSLIVKLSGKRRSDSMQGIAGRDPEFHIRPLLFQITSLPCPAIHCSDDEDYSGSGSDNEQSHHHDEENFDD